MPFSILTAVKSALASAKNQFLTLFFTGILGWILASIVFVTSVWSHFSRATQRFQMGETAEGIEVMGDALGGLLAMFAIIGVSTMAQYALLGGDVRGKPLNPFQAWIKAFVRLPNLLCASIPLTLAMLVVGLGPAALLDMAGQPAAGGFLFSMPFLAFLSVVALPLPYLAITDGRWFSAFTMAVRTVWPIFFPVLGGLILLTLVLTVLGTFVGVFVGLGVVVLTDLVPSLERSGEMLLAFVQMLVSFYTAYATMAYAAYVFEQVSVVENTDKNP